MADQSISNRHSHAIRFEIGRITSTYTTEENREYLIARASNSLDGWLRCAAHIGKMPGGIL
jgi:hypothetical protein